MIWWQVIWAMLRAILFPKKKVVTTSPIPSPPQPPVPQPQPKKRKQKYMWVLDNGHGALTAGKRSARLDDGKILREYEFNRDIVARIKAALFLEGIAYKELVPEVNCADILRERVRRLNIFKSKLPKILVSVHANAFHFPFSTPSGVEVWYKHNDTFSKLVASIFQRNIVQATGWLDRGIKSKKEKQFYILKHSQEAAILTENGFYTNPKQVLELLDTDKRQAIAQAHVDAILEIEQAVTLQNSSFIITHSSLNN